MTTLTAHWSHLRDAVARILVGRGFNRDISDGEKWGFRDLCVSTAFVGKPLKLPDDHI